MTNLEQGIKKPALILYLICVLKIWIAGSWSTHYVELLLGVGGLIAVLFPDEFSSYQGYQAWRSNQWRFQPPGWIQCGGAVWLALCAFSILIYQLGFLHRLGQ